MTLKAVNRAAQRVRDSERVPSPLEEARLELRKAMRQARAKGFTFEQIGDAAGLSRQRVWTILNRS